MDFFKILCGTLLGVCTWVSNLCAAPAIIQDIKGDRFACVTLHTNTGPMILTNRHCVRYPKNKYLVLPGNYYVVPYESNSFYDVCWLRPIKKLSVEATSNFDYVTLQKLNKGDVLLNENLLRSHTDLVIHNEMFNVLAGGNTSWGHVIQVGRTSGHDISPGCSGSPVYKDAKVAGIVCGYNIQNNNVGYMIPSSIFKNKKYIQTKYKP